MIFLYSEEHAIPTVEPLSDEADVRYLATMYPDVIYFEVEREPDPQWLVEITYNTHHDGAPVKDGDERPRTLHGVFASATEADEWATDRTDGDTDVHEVLIVPLNSLEES